MNRTELMILRVLSDGSPKYGLTIQEQLNDLFIENVSLGSIYTALKTLENKGLTTAFYRGSPRRYYQITDKGHEIARRKYTPPDPWFIRIFLRRNPDARTAN